tara:strand:+ start:1235 stop:1936 length:702 start_codon:yes stop_codon:yes gene_type:complete
MEIVEIKRQTLVKEVSNQLAKAIRNGFTGPDGLLPSERRLAAQFGVSRPVVREATKMLEFQGLVEIHQGLGIRVVDRLYAPLSAAAKLLLPDDMERLRQSLDVRMVLEPEIAKRAAERATEQGIAKLHEIQRLLEAASSLEEAMEADIAFHSHLAEISGNNLFGIMLDSIADLGRESRRATMSEVGFERAFRQHAVLLSAIEKGDVSAAEQAMRDHICAAVHDLIAHLEMGDN